MGGSGSFAGGELSPGASCSFTVEVQVPAGATSGSYTSTTSSITGMTGGGPINGNAAEARLFVSPVPIFTKTFLSLVTSSLFFLFLLASFDSIIHNTFPTFFGYDSSRFSHGVISHKLILSVLSVENSLFEGEIRC